MKRKEKIARKNLKKTFAFASVIGFLTIGGGLAISLPTYYQIQKNLKKDVSNLVNLTSFMSELTTKLGINPDEKFVQDLKNGYTLVFSNGETLIYKKGNNDINTLIMNMNKNGSIGSAATFSGVAAKGILEIIDNANKALSNDAKVMNDIINNFKEETEKRSFKVESVILGLTIDEIKARNILSNNNKLQAKKAFAKFQKDLQVNKKKLVNQTKINQIIQNTQQNKNVLNSNNFLKIQKNLQNKIKQAKSKLKQVFKDSIFHFWSTWHVLLLNKIAEVQKDFPNEHKTINEILQKTSKANLKRWINTLSLNDLQKKDETVDNFLNVFITQTNAKQTQKQKQLEKNPGGLIKAIAKNVETLSETFIRSLGYQNNYDLANPQGTSSSKSIENKVFQAASEAKYSKNDLQDMITFFKRIGNYKGEHLTKKIEVKPFLSYNNTNYEFVILEFQVTSFYSSSQVSFDKNYLIFERKNNNNALFFPKNNLSTIKNNILIAKNLYEKIQEKKGKEKIIEDLKSWFTNNANFSFYQNNKKMIEFFVQEVQNGKNQNIWEKIMENKIRNYLLNETLLNLKNTFSSFFLLENDYKNYKSKINNLTSLNVLTTIKEIHDKYLPLKKENGKVYKEIEINIIPQGKYLSLANELKFAYKAKVLFSKQYLDKQKQYFVFKHFDWSKSLVKEEKYYENGVVYTYKEIFDPKAPSSQILLESLFETLLDKLPNSTLELDYVFLPNYSENYQDIINEFKKANKKNNKSITLPSAKIQAHKNLSRFAQITNNTQNLSTVSFNLITQNGNATKWFHVYFDLTKLKQGNFLTLSIDLLK